MSTELSQDAEDEVEGNIINIIHVDDSGTDPQRTVLGLATKDDLSVSIDESTESWNPSIKRRTQRYRTANEIDIEFTEILATSQDTLELLGLVDADGKLDFDNQSRRLGSDQYLEIAYANKEMDYTTDPGPSDFELVHRASDVETMLGDIDPSSTPPTASLTVMVHGDLWINADTLGA